MIEALSQNRSEVGVSPVRRAEGPAPDQEMIMDLPTDEADEPVRIPGLFRAWDFGQLLRPGQSYRVEDAGATEEGTPLFAVFEVTSPHPVDRRAGG
jgi:hypothetical protein